MRRKLGLFALAAAAAVFTASAALAQADFSDIFGALNDSRGRNQAAEQHHVQRLMNHPRVQHDYRQYLARGGRMGFYQYAYQWGMTNGFTPEGMAHAYGVQRGINQQNQQAWQRYQQHQEDLRRGQQHMYDQQAWRREEQGRVMVGANTWWVPGLNQCVAIAYTQMGEPYEGPVRCPPGFVPPQQRW